MDLKGIIVLRLVVVLCIITLTNGTIFVNINDVFKCDGQSKSVIDRSGENQSINAYCRCTVISNFTGTLFFQDNNTCQNKIDHNKTLIITPCIAGYGEHIFFNKGETFFLIFNNFNNSEAQPSKLKKYVKVYADMYVIAAGSMVVVVALVVFVLVYIRRRDRDQSKQQLPNNPLYQAYWENDDVGYSTCENENQSSTEQIPDNPLYHDDVNDDIDDSKSEKDMSVYLPSQGEMKNHRNTSKNVSDNNAVYAQPNKLAKVSIVNQTESAEDQNENIYAQVNKPKRE